MKTEIKNPFPDDNCFFCGCDNNEGLKLKFFWDQEKKETYTEWLPAAHYIGQGNILHGAFQMGILDEIMGWAVYACTQEMAVTADFNVRFLHPTYISGEKVKVTCRVVSKEGSKINMQATLTNSDGVACTEATGVFRIISANKYNKLIQGR